MAPRPEDRRQHPRIPFVLRVDYRDRRAFLGATENLSHGGLFIQTDLPFRVGERVALQLSFPALLDPVDIQGEVTWVRPLTDDRGGGIGLCVNDLAERQRLEELLTQTDTASASGPRPLPAEGFRVLIVEDNPHIIEMYSYVLKKLAAGDLAGKVPLEVHFAPDGHHALKLLQGGRFNLVMTDLYMPVMDGFILVEKIRGEAALQNIPIIAISAGGKEAQARAMELGVDIFLRKPVRFAEVLETVKQLLHIK